MSRVDYDLPIVLVIGGSMVPYTPIPYLASSPRRLLPGGLLEAKIRSDDKIRFRESLDV